MELATTVRKWIEINIPAILFNIETDNGAEEEVHKKILCAGGGGGGLSLACMLGEALKTNEKESYMTQKMRLVTSEFLILPPPI